jgi:hypothetical protein
MSPPTAISLEAFLLILLQAGAFLELLLQLRSEHVLEHVLEVFLRAF